MNAVPLPIAAFAAASYVAPALVAPFFRRLMLHPRRHVSAPPALTLRAADQRLDLGEGLVAWQWGEGPTVLLAHGFEGSTVQFGAVIDALVERGGGARHAGPRCLIAIVDFVAARAMPSQETTGSA